MAVRRINDHRTLTALPESRYHQNGAAEKVLGAVYTPPRVASALVRWAVRAPGDRVLDPSCGEGVFLAAAQTHLADLGDRQPTCVGVDIDPQAAAAADGVCSDFFEWADHSPLFQSSHVFDAVVGNPPFIRSHLFPERSRALAFRQMKEMGLHPSRLMSTWAPFVALSCKLLSDTGRLALVVPEELLHVGYAEELRRFLLHRFRRVIVCLPNGDLFPSVQQSVVLLLCDQESAASGLLTMSFEQLEQGPPYPVDPAPVWDWCPKWTHLFLSPNERLSVSESFQQLAWKPFKEYGRVEVGVVTGSNDFFILSKSEAEALGDGNYLTPIITSARDLRGICFSTRDFKALIAHERPLFLLYTYDAVESLPPQLRTYLDRGVEQGVNSRFKCRNREPWYAVPSVWPADALLLRQAGEIPKLVHLSKKFTSTDTIHRVRWRRPSLGKRHVVSFVNTWTLIACEITGRSYGGGVLELMPGEANHIPLPSPVKKLEAVFKEVDARVRERQFEAAIEVVDRIVTPSCIAVSEYQKARDILSKLISRRRMKQNGHN